jgi:hypothetical protein
MAGSDEFEIKLTASERPGWGCPNCHGLGRLADGSLSISGTEIRGKLRTKCSVCNGHGRVKVVAFTEEELKRAQRVLRGD